METSQGKKGRSASSSSVATSRVGKSRRVGGSTFNLTRRKIRFYLSIGAIKEGRGGMGTRFDEGAKIQAPRGGHLKQRYFYVRFTRRGGMPGAEHTLPKTEAKGGWERRSEDNQPR